MMLVSHVMNLKGASLDEEDEGLRERAEFILRSKEYEKITKQSLRGWMKKQGWGEERGKFDMKEMVREITLRKTKEVLRIPNGTRIYFRNGFSES